MHLLGDFFALRRLKLPRSSQDNSHPGHHPRKYRTYFLYQVAVSPCTVRV
ncbi:hypothetical protein CORMATOL_01943 [Corynebacterium matruchotii ATCC 33806]|uniref:Uncharacterized protein n=1 Tax=Corynebacterium matruchotii ATCC 33806 TaxID=566549 RepID=C0E4L8_9CORY|nr:hypothetical protein CORMATOL_01943 [Corynebacterium matruchotii ATCC 33806]